MLRRFLPFLTFSVSLFGCIGGSFAQGDDTAAEQKKIAERIAKIEAYMKRAKEEAVPARADEVDARMTPAEQANAYRKLAIARIQESFDEVAKNQEFDFNKPITPDANEIAIIDLSRALELEPDHVLTWINRACAYSRGYQLEFALNDARHAVKLDPRSADAYFLCAWIELENSDFEACIASAGKALELKPDFRDALLQRAQAEHRQGATRAAIADFSRAISLGAGSRPRMPDNFRAEFAHPVAYACSSYVNARYGRAACYYREKNWEGAYRDLLEAGLWEECRWEVLPYLYVLQPRLPAELAKSPGATRESLRAAMAQTPQKLEGRWFNQCNAYLRGELTEPSFVAAAKQWKSFNQDQAWYFIGMQHLAAGKISEAAHCFRTSVDTIAPYGLAFDFATAELKAMGPN